MFDLGSPRRMQPPVYFRGAWRSVSLSDHLAVQSRAHLDAASILGPCHPALVAAGVGSALRSVHNQVIRRQRGTCTGAIIGKTSLTLFRQFLLSHVFPCGCLKVLKMIIDKGLFINCQHIRRNILKRCNQIKSFMHIRDVKDCQYIRISSVLCFSDSKMH